jgi:hypothetical protein
MDKKFKSPSLNLSHIWTHPALQGQCLLMTVTLSTSMEEVHDQYNKASKYYWVIGLSETNTIG